jgi:hypothetical protein
LRFENVEENLPRRHSKFYILRSIFLCPFLLRSTFLSAFLASALFPGGPRVSADIIDRIAVSVASSVITASEVDRAIRVTAFQNGAAPDFRAANRRETAQRLVDQRLVRREMEFSRYPQPDPSEAGPLLDQLRASRYKTVSEFQQALKDDGVSEQDLRDALLWELTLVRFIEARFRPAIQVSNQELEAYFEKVVRPAAQAAHPGQPVVLDDYRSRIEEKLAGQRADQEVDKWLKEARKRTEIEVHEEAFQ